MQGILIDVLTEALQKRMGIQLVHEGYPWARAQILVKQGQADAFVTVPTPERRTYTEVNQEPVVLATFNIFTSVKNPRLDALKTVETISQLKNFNLVHYLGSGWAKKNLAEMNVDWANTLDQSLLFLAKGRADALIDVSQVIQYAIRNLKLNDQLVKLPNVIDSSPFNLCIGKTSPYVNILSKVDQTLRKMKKDGALDKIYEKYR